MRNTLVNNSKILKIKSKFFLGRALLYSSFLLIPVWVPKLLELNNAMQVLVVFLYTTFICSQWFLLGKEVDHRLKIYFRVSSSMDRVVYRLLMGMTFMAIYFGLLGFLPKEVIKHFYWGTWIFLGLFYSWPTRGKIIEETMSGQLIEFKFLDPFEKTILALLLVVFLISVPRLPSFIEDTTALKLFLDPDEKFSVIFWNFLNVNYFPFMKFPKLMKLSYFLYFYLIGLGLFLISFYALVRFFMSRRLAMLGVFSLVSSWTFAKMFEQNISIALTSTYSLLWCWGLFWSLKSGTYRSGLMVGLLGFWGTLLSPANYFLLPLEMIILYFFFFNFKNIWFRKQLLKYTLLGLFLSSIIFFSDLDGALDFFPQTLSHMGSVLLDLIEKKAFYILSPLGLLFIIYSFVAKKHGPYQHLRSELNKLGQFFLIVVMLFCYSLFLETNLMNYFSLMWVVAFIGLIPLEWIFTSINRMRSRRNMIYLIYILICLLDSHIEGRIKGLMEFFK